MAYIETDPTPVYNADTEISESELLSAEQLAEFADLYRDEYPKLLYRAHQFSNSKDPEALVQTAFENALKRWDSYTDQGIGRRAWLYRIMTNVGINEYRRFQRRPEDPSSDWHEFNDRPDQTVEAEFESAGTDTIMELARKALRSGGKPERWFQIVYLTSHGYAYQEIADILDTPVGTVMSALFRARKFLGEDPSFNAAYRQTRGEE